MKSIDAFTESDWSRLEADWRAWWQGELERPLISIITDHGGSQPAAALPPDASIAPLAASLPAGEILDQLEPGLGRQRYWADAYPQFVPNFGLGISAAVLGSELRLIDGASWMLPLQLDTLDDLTLELDQDNLWWRRAQEITSAAAARWGMRLAVGPIDLGTSLDTLAYLRGEEALYGELARQPKLVDRLIPALTDIQLAMSAQLQQLCEGTGVRWLSGKGTLLSSFTAAMISPRMFKRWILPDLERRCQALAYPSCFLDGERGRHTLEMVLSIPGLSAVQYYPGSEQPPLEQWLPHLQRIREAGKRCQLWAAPETALGIIEAMGGSGFHFTLIQPDRPLNADEAEAFLSAI